MGRAVLWDQLLKRPGLGVLRHHVICDLILLFLLYFCLFYSDFCRTLAKVIEFIEQRLDWALTVDSKSLDTVLNFRRDFKRSRSHIFFNRFQFLDFQLKFLRLTLDNAFHDIIAVAAPVHSLEECREMTLQNVECGEGVYDVVAVNDEVLLLLRYEGH